MRMPALAATMLVPLLAAGPLAAAEPPRTPSEAELTEGAINGATLADWKARQAAPAGEAAKPGGTMEGQGENAAEDDGGAAAKEAAEDRPDPFLVRLQVLLDRAHASPGVVDGRSGGNTDKAIRAFEAMRGLDENGAIDEELWDALSKDAAPAVKTYALTQEDVDGRYVPDLPSDYGALAKLDWLGYRGPAEMLAERFHMDEDLLRALNPQARFEAAGETVLVADPGAPPEAKVERIVVDRSKGELLAYGADETLVFAAPATIGSEDTPSPSGTMTVNGSAPDPTYEYDPEKNFRQGDNTEKLTLPPGPNGPVGSVWIDLSKPTYGIHGTAEPSQIDKTASHGCVRLTNWDAEALSKLVLPAETKVAFEG